uniref:Legumain n=1 Tax=Panagrolaimus davidi TaxID=227884 RepID=A0A914QX06_9BILA
MGNPKGNTWAVLIAGTKDWDNYRHQADICHSYHILIENGVKPEHIIVMMYDDIAFNKQNMYPGKVFNEPRGKDVYNGIKIDYSGSFVTSEIFLNVLKGNKSGNAGKGSGRVLESGELDYVFVFYVAHGDHEILGMPEESVLHKNELFDTFKI